MRLLSSIKGSVEIPGRKARGFSASKILAELFTEFRRCGVSMNLGSPAVWTIEVRIGIYDAGRYVPNMGTSEVADS
jgi:hypothetical protein